MYKLGTCFFSFEGLLDTMLFSLFLSGGVQTEIILCGVTTSGTDDGHVLNCVSEVVCREHWTKQLKEFVKLLLEGIDCNFVLFLIFHPIV